MEKRPRRRPAQYNRKYHQKNKPQDQPDTTRLGNQLSLSVLLCVFFIAIASIGGTTAQKIRSKASDLIGRNALDEFQAGDSLKDNIGEFVRCMFSYGDDDSSQSTEEEITEDMQNEKNDTSASDASLPKGAADTGVSAASGSSDVSGGSEISGNASDSAASKAPAPE